MKLKPSFGEATEQVIMQMEKTILDTSEDKFNTGLRRTEDTNRRKEATKPHFKQFSTPVVKGNKCFPERRRTISFGSEFTPDSSSSTFLSSTSTSSSSSSVPSPPLPPPPPPHEDTPYELPAKEHPKMRRRGSNLTQAEIAKLPPVFQYMLESPALLDRKTTVAPASHPVPEPVQRKTPEKFTPSKLKRQWPPKQKSKGKSQGRVFSVGNYVETTKSSFEHRHQPECTVLQVVRRRSITTTGPTNAAPSARGAASLRIRWGGTMSPDMETVYKTHKTNEEEGEDRITRPEVWVTQIENGGQSAPDAKKWRIKRIWNIDSRDDQEPECTLPHEQVIPKLKELLGIQRSNDEDAKWLVLRVWDVDGEIDVSETMERQVDRPGLVEEFQAMDESFNPCMETSTNKKKKKMGNGRIWISLNNRSTPQESVKEETEEEHVDDTPPKVVEEEVVPSKKKKKKGPRIWVHLNTRNIAPSPTETESPPQSQDIPEDRPVEPETANTTTTTPQSKKKMRDGRVWVSVNERDRASKETSPKENATASPKTETKDETTTSTTAAVTEKISNKNEDDKLSRAQKGSNTNTGLNGLARNRSPNRFTSLKTNGLDRASDHARHASVKQSNSPKWGSLHERDQGPKGSVVSKYKTAYEQNLNSSKKPTYKKAMSMDSRLSSSMHIRTTARFWENEEKRNNDKPVIKNQNAALRRRKDGLEWFSCHERGQMFSRQESNQSLDRSSHSFGDSSDDDNNDKTIPLKDAGSNAGSDMEGATTDSSERRKRSLRVSLKATGAVFQPKTVAITRTNSLDRYVNSSDESSADEGFNSKRDLQRKPRRGKKKSGGVCVSLRSSGDVFGPSLKTKTAKFPSKKDGGFFSLNDRQSLVKVSDGKRGYGSEDGSVCSFGGNASDGF